MNEHKPERGSDVEAWIKRERDALRHSWPDGWIVLDGLLDHYRLHADLGAPLHLEVSEHE